MRRSSMSILLATLAILATSAWVGFSKAQQPQAAGSPSNRAELGRGVAKQRAELDLLRIEHEAARLQLLPVLQRKQQLEFKNRIDPLTPFGLLIRNSWVVTGSEREGDSIREMTHIVKREGGDEAVKKLTDAADEDLKKLTAHLDATVDRAKKDYLEQSRVVEEKSLELAVLEKRYNESK